MRAMRDTGPRARRPHLPCRPATSFCLSLVADESMTADDVQRHDHDGSCAIIQRSDRIVTNQRNSFLPNRIGKAERHDDAVIDRLRDGR